jgi:hypothetical protein
VVNRKFIVKRRWKRENGANAGGINVEFNTGQDEMDKNRLGNLLPA